MRACDVRSLPPGHNSPTPDGIGRWRPRSRAMTVGTVAKRSEFLPFSRPVFGEEEIHEVVDTLRSSWITTGPKTGRFESEFAAYLQAPGALALNSCTAALHAALVTLGIGAGDEVITTPMTFSASVNVIEHVGARPVLVDVEPDTLNIDAGQVEAAITPRTRAILAVHYAGHPVDLDALRALASAHRLALVEDAAHALPARYKGRLIGGGYNRVAFSFYATKNLTTAEGGRLTGEPALELPVTRPEVEHAWHLYVLRLRPGTLTIDRNRFIQELSERNVGTSVHFIPIHVHPYYRDKYGFKPDTFPVAYAEYRRILSLPLHPGLSDGDVGHVIEAVLDVVRSHRV